MEELIKHLIRTIIDWLFRRKSPALFTMRLGFSCLVLALGAGWALNVSIPLSSGTFNFSLNNGAGTPLFIISCILALGAALILIGLIWELQLESRVAKQIAKKRVLVIEARGLREGAGTALSDNVAKTIIGHRDPLVVDVRQGLVDGKIVSPDVALERIRSLPVDIGRREAGSDRNDITRVYGGLAPVPLTFLTGVMLDDEMSTVIYDWDRHRKCWRPLDGRDDGKRFRVAGLADVPKGAGKVALLISVSYCVDLDGVSAKVGDMPKVALELEDGTPDSHWSEDKQAALGQQFLETAIELGNKGVRRVHMFLAAQNSLVFRLGTLYDKRNLPELIVYQYQREEAPPYPWGVKMPVSGQQAAAIVSGALEPSG